MQQNLLDLWWGEGRDHCVVGDPAQTIHSFAGASPVHLTGFADRFPDADGGAAGARLPLHVPRWSSWPTRWPATPGSAR